MYGKANFFRFSFWTDIERCIGYMVIYPLLNEMKYIGDINILPVFSLFGFRSINPNTFNIQTYLYKYHIISNFSFPSKFNRINDSMLHFFLFVLTPLIKQLYRRGQKRALYLLFSTPSTKYQEPWPWRPYEPRRWSRQLVSRSIIWCFASCFFFFLFALSIERSHQTSHQREPHTSLYTPTIEPQPNLWAPITTPLFHSHRYFNFPSLSQADEPIPFSSRPSSTLDSRTDRLSQANWPR